MPCCRVISWVSGIFFTGFCGRKYRLGMWLQFSFSRNDSITSNNLTIIGSRGDKKVAANYWLERFTLAASTYTNESPHFWVTLYFFADISCWKIFTFEVKYQIDIIITVKQHMVVVSSFIEKLFICSLWVLHMYFLVLPSSGGILKSQHNTRQTGG